MQLKQQSWGRHYMFTNRLEMESYDLDRDDSDFDPHFQQQEVHSCEMHWLEPEPDRVSNGYEYYIKGLRVIQGQINVYTGYHRPPTEDEYNELAGE